jgi:hypothetical protein
MPCGCVSFHFSHPSGFVIERPFEIKRGGLK